MAATALLLALPLSAALGAPPPAPSSPAPERQLLVGSWTLVSRADRLPNGETIPEPNLGSDPLGFLVYDAAGHVAAQLMKRGARDAAALVAPPPAAGMNNTGAVGSYDAYFGTYSVDDAARTVTHHLLAALSPADVGKSVTRRFVLAGDELRLSFDTTSASGDKVVRTLVWRRASPR